MTPRQIAAYLVLVDRRHQRLAAKGLYLNALAAQGGGKDIQREIKDLLK